MRSAALSRARCFAVSPARASVYSAEYVFGDSLSDRGNVAAAVFGTNFPDPPSNHDSFTNGPVAVQLLAQSFGLNANPSLWVTGFQDPNNMFGGPLFVPGTNYAVGGATSAIGTDGINLPEQVGAFSAFEHGVADHSALYVIMIGGNDVRDAAMNVPTDPAAITAGVKTELAAISTLSGEGAKDVFDRQRSQCWDHPGIRPGQSDPGRGGHGLEQAL